MVMEEDFLLCLTIRVPLFMSSDNRTLKEVAVTSVYKSRMLDYPLQLCCLFFSFLGWELYSFNPLSLDSLSTNTLQTLLFQGIEKLIINAAHYFWAVLCCTVLV